jgi:O-acetylhomoserine (thiol)-lyase
MGPIAYIIKARVTLLRDCGQCMSPFNAFNFIQGLETLPLRIREQCKNAKLVAEHLSLSRNITKVIYPSLFTGENKNRVNKYLNNGYGALVGFEIEGGIDAGKKFIDSLELLYHVANIGDSRSLAIHPASTTHSQLSSQDQLKSGVTPSYVRLSIGIEHIEDIINDIDQALIKSKS